MAGHSKWANIQHRKGRQDAARSKLFSKLSKEITVAAKMGDPDPEKIDFDMPVEVVFDDALGRKDKDGNSYISYFFKPIS